MGCVARRSSTDVGYLALASVGGMDPSIVRTRAADVPSARHAATHTPARIPRRKGNLGGIDVFARLVACQRALRLSIGHSNDGRLDWHVWHGSTLVGASTHPMFCSAIA